MEAILDRPREQDATDFRRRLRKHYEEDLVGYMRLLGQERDRAKARPGEQGSEAADVATDEGSDAALATLENFMVGLRQQMEVEEQLAQEIVDRWPKLPEERKETVLRGAGIPYTVKEGKVVYEWDGVVTVK
jgi:hypothetical protein